MPATDAPAKAMPGSAPAEVISISSVAGEALARSVGALLDLQNEDGHWRGELEGDSITASEYILMKWILRQEDDPRLPKIVQHLRNLQRPDGGWAQYPDATSIDVSATVKAYLCLRLAGDAPDEPHLQQAAHLIRHHGGAEACNSFTNFFLACLGLISWDACPAIPPEIVLAPNWLPCNLKHLSAWSRTMILPLAICSALRPITKLPATVSIAHLFVDPQFQDHLNRSFNPNPATFHNFFLLADRALKTLQAAEALPLRALSLRRAEAWLLERADPQYTAGLGAIFPPMVYFQVALQALGYPRGHPVRQQAEHDLDELLIEEEETIRIEPCFSPVWDTGIALYALTERAVPHRPRNPMFESAVCRAAEFLRDKEIRRPGGWARDNHDSPPAGWSFEYHNDWYPDVDDTAMVSMALLRAGGNANRAAAKRGVEWMLALQNEDGGWAAFDRTRDRPMLEQIPFADHNAIQDPSCADITGRVLECLAHFGLGTEDAAVQRGIEFLRRTQEPEGCWFGRWGVNYIYGTWQAIGGLTRIGVDPAAGWIRHAGRWLKSIQKPDGSFGESADSYLDSNLKGVGPATASQTAWAALSLMSIFGRRDSSVKSAICYLTESQINTGDDRGTWHESEFTGTGFPKVYYLRYHLYPLYFPLLALARYLSP